MDVILGGIFSSTRQAIKRPAVTEGKTLYIYPEQYEGQESDPLIFCTGPVPAQQVDPLVPWLMERTGAKTFYLPSADYIWPHVMNARVREVVTANGGSIVGEEYFPLDHADYRATVERIVASGADVVFNMTVPPGFVPFFEQLHESGFAARGGQLVCTYFDENMLNIVPPAHVEGLYSCLDYYQDVADPFSRRLTAQYDALYPGARRVHAAASAARASTAGCGCGPRRSRRPARCDQAEVIAALDHAHIAEGPGGPATVVPGPAPRAHEHVHRPGHGRPLPGRRGAGRDRSPGAPGRRPRAHRLSATPTTHRRKELTMLLATTQVEDFDRFLDVFSTAGADKRRQHGSKGALVFRDPSEADRVWVVFDWDEQGWQSFVSDPEVPPIMKEAGHKGKPQAAQLARRIDA